MRRRTGEKIEDLVLPEIKDGLFDLSKINGKRFMLSFLRFASCPFCNLRVHELVSRYNEFGDNFNVVAVFDSSLENLRLHADKHQAPFPILADEKNVYYKKFGIEHSIFGMIKGIVKRMPSMLYAMFWKGYLPFVIKGNLTTLPADFLVDEYGIIQCAYYGKDDGDHLPFDEVKSFSLKSQNISTPLDYI